MTAHTMAVIGLTGGIASGKSTVAARWRQRGAHIIDADMLAREVVAPGEPALAAIAATFGAQMLSADGSLDRGRLGALVFGDPAALRKLNAITHPAIMSRVGHLLLEARTAKWPWVVYEAALIIENQLTPGLTGLAVVLAEPETQLHRLIARDGLDETGARARLAAQTDNGTREEAGDWVLWNAGTLEELLEASDQLFDALVARYGAVPPAGSDTSITPERRS